MTVQDDIGDIVTFYYPPIKIVSLVPSITELLIDLGLENELAGITKYCIFPEEKVSKLNKIGGTKNPDLQKIIDLKPDLVIANKEENQKEHIEFLRASNIPVYVTYIDDYDSALNMIENIGMITDRKSKANSITRAIDEKFDNFESQVNVKKVAYMIWKQPYMTIGKNTFINSMLTKIGFENVFENYEGNYPVITQDDIIKSETEFIFLSTEPYKFSEKHIHQFQKIKPDAKIVIVEGDKFSWYGSRMLLAADYFQNLVKTL